MGRLVGSVRGARTADPVFALTFDDGPDADETPRALAVLARHGARATFFVLAQRAEQMPQLVRAVEQAGHEVALHGDDHTMLTAAAWPQVKTVVRGGKRRLERVTGSRVRLFRPPYGFQNLRSYMLARALGMKVVSWTSVADDWVDIPAREVVEAALEGLDRGGILLLHERFETHPDIDFTPPRFDRAEVLDQILAAAAARGLRAVTVGDLIAGRRINRHIWFWKGDGTATAP